jgi:hypothetical protein
LICIIKASKSAQFPELKPARSSQVYYSLLILNRLGCAVCFTCFNWPTLQLCCLCAISALVSSTQQSLYLLVVRPINDLASQVKQLGFDLAVTSYLTALIYCRLSNDSSLIVPGFFTAISAIFVTALLELLIKVVKTVIQILNEVEVDPLAIAEV